MNTATGLKGEDCSVEMIDFAALEAAFCDTRQVHYYVLSFHPSFIVLWRILCIHTYTYIHTVCTLHKFINSFIPPYINAYNIAMDNA